MAKETKAESSKATLKDYKVIRRPIVTEKASIVMSTSVGASAVDSSGSTSTSPSKFIFEVDRRASKAEIKVAIQNLFSVDVETVRTLNYLGKLKRSARGVGRRVSSKRAYVTLKEGQTISIVEGV